MYVVTSDDIRMEEMSKTGTLTKKDSMRWTMNRKLLEQNLIRLRSDVFRFGPCRDSKFHLFLVSNKSSAYFSVGLVHIPDEATSLVHDDDEVPPPIPIKVSFSLLDNRDRCHHTCDRIFKESNNVQANFDRSCYTTNQMTFAVGGMLTIHCSMDVSEVLSELESPECSKQDTASMPGDLSSDLVLDLRNLLEKEILTDVVLRVGSDDFKAHRAILAARSPVFAAMFEHDTIEKRQNQVVISDISSDAMKQLLRFFYTSETDDLTMAELMSLFVAADKYNIPKLKEKCSSILCTQVTSEIGLDVLVLASQHASDELKEAATRVILDNAMDVVNTPEWLTFLKEYPELANGIILNLAIKSANISDISSDGSNSISHK